MLFESRVVFFAIPSHKNLSLASFCWYRLKASTVEPVYNGHSQDLKNWPLNTGSLKLLSGHCLMSILMAYHTNTLHARKQ